MKRSQGQGDFVQSCSFFNIISLFKGHHGDAAKRPTAAEALCHPFTRAEEPGPPHRLLITTNAQWPVTHAAECVTFRRYIYFDKTLHDTREKKHQKNNTKTKIFVYHAMFFIFGI